ncbi:MAG: sulfatase/phosphatase domain-containing protein [Bryobacteraceae bacterium]
MGRGKRNDFVTQTDLAPTLAAAAGIEWPTKVDGFDLAKNRNQRDAVYSEYYSQQRVASPIRTIRTRRWKLNWYDSGSKELYDLKKDPRELNNLAGADLASKVQAELEGKLEAWRPAMRELEKESTEY